jgi:hypothetical protein
LTYSTTSAQIGGGVSISHGRPCYPRIPRFTFCGCQVCSLARICVRSTPYVPQSWGKRNNAEGLRPSARPMVARLDERETNVGWVKARLGQAGPTIVPRHSRGAGIQVGARKPWQTMSPAYSAIHLLGAAAHWRRYFCWSRGFLAAWACGAAPGRRRDRLTVPSHRQTLRSRVRNIPK